MREPGSDPRLTVDLVGHADAERQLLELWRGGRMPHAVMIAGRPGIGKATLGYRLARFVLAAETAGGLFGDAPDSLYLSPDNPVFRRVASGGHVDLMVLERPWDEKRNRRRGVIPIELARKAISFLRLTAGEGGWRVLLVDAADDLNPNAANALLKIMEEPPRHVLLILIANAPGQVLPTIRSRCRRITLSPLSDAETMAVVQARRPDATADDQALAVSLAEGSPGQALDLLEQGAAAVYTDLVDLIASLPDYGFAKALAFAEKVGTSTDDAPFAVFRTLFTGWLSRLLGGAVAGDRAGSTGQEAGMNSRLATAGALDPWFEVWDKARTWFAETEGLNLDRKQAVLAVIEACAAAARRSA
ncbi:MAG: DNA polymerase III subunit delta', partial [Alphaproteobacteria bacterium]